MKDHVQNLLTRRQWSVSKGLHVTYGFNVNDLFDCVGWTIFLEKFSTLRYCPYALFWGTNRPDKVNIRGCVNRKEVIIFSKTITAASDCLEEVLVFDKDREDIT